MKILRIDFTSAPGPKKSIAVAEGELNQRNPLPCIQESDRQISPDLNS